MKQALEYRNQPVTKYTSKPTGTMLPEAWVAALFEKMRRRYGNLWTKNIGETPEDAAATMDEWREVLGGITGDQLKFALDTWDAEYPPSVMQFRTRCRSMERKPMHQIQPKIEHKPRTANRKASAAEAVAEMRASLLDSGADLNPEVSPTLDTSRDWYAAHGYTNIDGDYDAWLMSKPHQPGDKPKKHYRRET